MSSISIAGVCERDIDLLLLEEFYSSPDFLLWFVEKVVGRALTGVTLVSAKRAVTQSIGESDLEVCFTFGNFEKCLLLIENKISAGFQRDQACRYRERGKAYCDRKVCHIYHTVLIAPKSYIGETCNKKEFDEVITYECIKSWYENNSTLGKRNEYKQTLLSIAINKSKYGYDPIADKPVTDFWQDYHKEAEAIAPELKMKKPTPKPSKAGFVYFHPSNFPKGIDIVHKLPHGFVDLQFRGWGSKVAQLKKRFLNYFDKCEVTSAYKSGCIRITVTRINPADHFSNHIVAVREGLEVARYLYMCFEKALSDGVSMNE